MTTRVGLAIAVALTVPGIALAHGTAIHARGTIKEITSEHVVLTDKGVDQTFALGPDTQILRGEGPVSVAAVRMGERAVIHARRDGEKMHATELKLAPESEAPARKERRR